MLLVVIIAVLLFVLAIAYLVPPRDPFDRDPDEPLPPGVGMRTAGEGRFEAPPGDPVVHDKPFYRRSAFYKMVTSILSAVALYYTPLADDIKVFIGIIENVAIFFLIDRLTYSPDPKEFVKAGGRLLERDGEPVKPNDVTKGLYSRLS